MDVFNWKSDQIDNLLAKQLEHKKPFLCSTDTVLGLMTPVSQAGKDALDKMKKRQNKPYLIIIGSLIQTEFFIAKQAQNDLAALFKKVWPGPVTLIMPQNNALPSYCTSADGTVALRFPAHQGLQKAALYFNGIFSTSANIHGMPIPNSIDQVDKSIIENVGAIITDSPTEQSTTASTIVDCTKKPYIIIREGAFEKKTLLKILANKN